MRRWLIWNLAFRLHEQLKGHATYEFLREMEAIDHLSEAELDERQRDKLSSLIRYSYAHVPYVQKIMRERNITPADILSVRDLRHLPLMQKSDVRENRALLRSKIAGKLASFTTGGSTGEPLIFDLSKRRVASRV